MKNFVILVFLFSLCFKGITMDNFEIETESTQGKACLVYPQHAQLGEGSIWSVQDQVLYWIDIEGKKLHIYNPKTNTNEGYNLNDLPGTVVQRTNGELLVAIRNGIQSFNTHTKEFKVVANPEKFPTNRYNDGKCDPQGRFWVSSMSLEHDNPPKASLYRIDGDFTSERIFDGVRIGNGLVWNSDSTKFYYIDTPTMNIDVMDFDAKSGHVSNRKHCITFSGQDGFPDGMTIDDQGKLWIAHWDGGRVTRWCPLTKKLLFTIIIPNVSKITSCAFGDSDLQTLYITTARDGSQPDSGSLFKYRFTNGIKGIPANNFRG